jgi:hypothetical protein
MRRSGETTTRGKGPRLGKLSKASLGVGVILLAVAAIWTPIAVPRLVKFPTSTNVRLAYAGSLVTYVNAANGATLQHPLVAKLSIDRHVQALAAKSSSAVALVRETLAVHAGSLDLTENNVYALDRRTMQAVPNPGAFTFAPGNDPNRHASYYVTLPMGVGSTTQVRMWKPESGTTYLLHPLAAGSAAAPSTLDGLAVSWFTGRLPMTLAPAYERSALAARGFPMSLTPAAVEARLAKAGVSVTRLGEALAPVLAPSELRTLLAVLSTPVALQYFIFGSGDLAAEPRTGVIVKLGNVVDGVSARPNPVPLQTVAALLGRHLNVPGVRSAIGTIRRIESAPPQPVYELRYTETSPSVAATVTLARNQIGQLNLATRDLPIGLGLLGLLLLSPAALQLARRRRRDSGSTESVITGHTSHNQSKAA